jgi:hypothetical protein
MMSRVIHIDASPSPAIVDAGATAGILTHGPEKRAPAFRQYSGRAKIPEAIGFRDPRYKRVLWTKSCAKRGWNIVRAQTQAHRWSGITAVSIIIDPRPFGS